MSLSANGLSVQTQSVLSILIGGIAFETPATDPVLPPAEANTVFTLFSDRAEAFKLPARDPQTFLLVFKQSVRGLAPGAPVEFRGHSDRRGRGGQRAGRREDLRVLRAGDHPLDAQRLGVKIVDLAPGADLDSHPQAADRHLGGARGARAAADGKPADRGAVRGVRLLPRRAPGDGRLVAEAGRSCRPCRASSRRSRPASSASSRSSTRCRSRQIGDDLQKAIVELDRTLVSARGTLDSGRGTLDNANKLIEPNSVLGAELGNTLQEVSRAARSVRVLADYLERHPEALIRGKTGEAK